MVKYSNSINRAREINESKNVLILTFLAVTNTPDEENGSYRIYIPWETVLWQGVRKSDKKWEKISLTWQCDEYNRLAYAGGLSQSGQGGTPSASEFSMANFQNRLALGPKRSSRSALVVREIVSRSPSCMYEIIYLIAVRWRSLCLDRSPALRYNPPRRGYLTACWGVLVEFPCA